MNTKSPNNQTCKKTNRKNYWAIGWGWRWVLKILRGTPLFRSSPACLHWIKTGSKAPQWVKATHLTVHVSRLTWAWIQSFPSKSSKALVPWEECPVMALLAFNKATFPELPKKGNLRTAKKHDWARDALANN